MAEADVLVIIPARVGSQRIPNKNFRPLAGRSPLLRAIDVSREAFPDASIVVTTDHPSFTDSRVIMQPQHARTSIVQVILDVYDRFPWPKSDSGVLVLVQPTQPLRTVTHLRQALAHYRNGETSVATVTETTSIDKSYLAVDGRLVGCGSSTEQDQCGRVTYRCDGTAYVVLMPWFRQHRTFRHPEVTRPVMISPAETCPLDTPEDWYRAELVLADRQRRGLV